MKTLSEMVDTSAKTILRNPEPHNPNYNIPQGHFRVDIPWEYSARLGLTFDAPDCLVYELGDMILLSANEIDEQFLISTSKLKLFDAVPLYFFKDNGWDESTHIDENYDCQFITLPKTRFPNFSIGDTIEIEYVDPCPPNAVWTHGISKDTVLEGERHLLLYKGEQHGLDTTNNSTNGQVQEMDGERHSTL